MKKGIAVETIVYGVIAVFALILLTMLFMKFIPSFNQMIVSAFGKMKSAFCDVLPWYARWIFCR
ncbi:MAG: hypothetical protein J7K83_03510 [Candidatus Aenigmarchaeota archaeon]|nr:hypothetical protein [Candidatus Aenigmarchaeota archaeon]